MSYALTTPPSSGLSTGDKVGIGVGGAAFLAMAIALLCLLRRAQVRRNARNLREATVIRTSNQEILHVPGFSATSPVPQTPVPGSPGAKSPGGFSHIGGSPKTPGGEGIPELPSPDARSQQFTPARSESYMGPGSGVTSPVTVSRIGSPTPNQRGEVVVPVMELEGSTFIHQHHPMYVAEGVSPNDGAGGGG